MKLGCNTKPKIKHHVYRPKVIIIITHPGPSQDRIGNGTNSLVQLTADSAVKHSHCERA